jgi:transposase
MSKSLLFMDITNEQWQLVSSIIEGSAVAKKVTGRPRVDDRSILNGILWICRTGAPWKDLPDKYPAYQTCHRRFQEWVKNKVWEKILVKLAMDLKVRGKMDLAECFIDGSFAAAKKGAAELGKLSGARVPRSWRLQTAMVFLSPYPHMKQVPMKLNSLKKHYQKALQKQSPND